MAFSTKGLVLPMEHPFHPIPPRDSKPPPPIFLEKKFRAQMVWLGSISLMSLSLFALVISEKRVAADDRAFVRFGRH